ncbi:MAG TPA: hypothetical protein ENH28_05985 [Euryarchaeota archaeon]|nr:hypothetical protein BMS3Bbin15_01331 [archaeon BMS3Bbin15]HDL15682.1 hypothetical protein [Euryarchaeota archaeon]
MVVEMMIGKAITPFLFAGAFVLMALGAYHMNPSRSKISGVATGIVALVGGIFMIINVVMFQSSSNLMGTMGPISNYMAGLGVLYGLFFTMIGLILIIGAKLHVMAPIAIVVGWITLAYAVFFNMAMNMIFPGGNWIYLASVAYMWFIAMNIAGFSMAGKVPERFNGGFLMWSSLYTFAIPGIMMALAIVH